MAENGIGIKELEKEAFRGRLKSHFWVIIVSVSIIIVTAILIYFYPKIECNKRLLFLISFIWPSGVIVVLVPMWTEIVRDLRNNIGYDIYRLLQGKVSEKFADSPKEKDVLRLMVDRREEIQSTDKATRRQAFTATVKEINEALQDC